MFSDFFSLFTSGAVGTMFSVFFNLLPFVLPPMLFLVGWSLYLTYKRVSFVAKLEPVLLEIVLPQEVERSAAAMELVYNVLNQPSFGTLAEVFLNGQVRPWFSLELISNGGSIRMFIWTWPKFKPLIESTLYSQYPNIEIRPAPDYTQSVLHDPTERFIWGVNFKLNGNDAMPLKTYEDYGLTQNPDEIVKIDPMTPLLEFMGSMTPHEKIWIQILVRAHSPTTWKHGDFSTWGIRWKDPKDKWKGVDIGNKNESWQDRINKEIEGIKDRAKPKPEGDKPAFSFTQFEPGQDDFIKILRRHQSKPGFDSLIRGFYIAEAGHVNASNISGLLAVWRPYIGANFIKPGHYTDHSDNMKDILRFTPFLKDKYQKKRWKMEEELFDAYKKRSIFYPPYQNSDAKPYVLNSEELSSLFHVIGSVSRTPTMERLESKKSEPPPNLPV